MAIDPQNTDAVAITQLDDLILALETFLVGSNANGKMGKFTTQQLAAFLAPIISSIGSSGYVPVSGTVLPNPVPGVSQYSFVGVGTYTWTGGSLVTTQLFNLVSSNGTTWTLSLAIPFTVADGSITTDKLATGAVTPVKTSFMTSVVTSKNKFNKATVITGRYMTAAGVITVSASNNYSLPIPIELGVEYRFRSAVANAGARFLTVFDASNNVIAAQGSDISVSSKTFTGSASYIVISVSNTGLADFQMEIGSASTAYTPYAETPSLSPDILIDADSLPIVPVDKIDPEIRRNSVKIMQSDLSFAEEQDGSDNLFDIDAPDVSLDSYLNASGATVTPSGTYNTTGFIDLSDKGVNTQIRCSRHRFSAFYDENKAFIAGSYNSTSGNDIILTIPEGAAYLRVSCPYTAVASVLHWPILMINYGTEALPFEPYSKSYWLLKDVKSELDTSDELLVFLPNDFYCAVDRTLEIYNSQAVWTGNIDNYHFLWSGVGKSMERKFTVTGTTGAIGSYPLTLTVYDNNMKQVAVASTNIHIVTKTISAPIILNPIGDSLTNTKAWQPELITLSAGQLSYQGTRGAIQVSPARTHEGRSGAKASYYLGNNSYTFDASGQVGIDGRTQDLNPYWNPGTSALDWAYYKSNYSKNPDAVLMWLGTNGIELDSTENVNDIKSFVDGLRATGASVPFYICLTLFRGDQNGIGNQTGSDGYVANTAWKLQEDRKVFNLQVALYDALKDYVDLHFIPISLCHDSLYNFTPSGASTPVNPRAWQTEALPSEATHPQVAGYNQIADIMFSVIAGTQ